MYLVSTIDAKSGTNATSSVPIPEKANNFNLGIKRSSVYFPKSERKKNRYPFQEQSVAKRAMRLN